MVTYHYSPIEDLKHGFWVRGAIKDSYYPKGVPIFTLSLKRMVWLAFWYFLKFKDPQIPESDNYDCHFVSSGCWGCFDIERKRIYVNPWKINCVPGGLVETILHEILHIKEYERTKNMSYEEREKYIEDKRKAEDLNG